MCKKQTCVSHSSTQSEIISLAASLRMDGIPALDNPNANQKQKFKQSTEKPVNQRNTECNTQQPQKHSELSADDFVSSNVNSSHKRTMLYIFEDDEAVIKMIIKSRSPARRNLSRTQRVAIDRLIDIIFWTQRFRSRRWTPRIKLADILTKGRFTEWNRLLCLCNVSLFSSQRCSAFSSLNCFEAVAKKTTRR